MPSIRADVFPANLTVTHQDQSAQLNKVRVILTDSEVRVFQDAAGGPKEIFRDTYAADDYRPATPIHRIPAAQRRAQGIQPGSLLTSTVTTASGRSLDFYRSGSCGCGSKLRNFDPFASETLTAGSSRDR